VVVRVVDAKGQLRLVGGVVASAGVSGVGRPGLRRRRSRLICGSEDDARAVIDHLAGYLAAGR
jgi:putative flavoprotein involved in K+ transport